MRSFYIIIAILAATVSASYVLEDDYAGDSFASMFDFFTGNDPTNGYVNYVSYDQATSEGLYKTENGAVYMGVDTTNVASGRGRDSVRLTTKKTYNHGLIILDLAHMPGGACGTWPAFWMLGPNWPVNGEIDIIEGVNSQSANKMTLHTNAGCSITSTGAFSGSLETANCDVNAPDQAQNAGCLIESQDTTSYGTGFNSNGGGVYATQWTSEAISIWFFPRNAVPSDISSGNPDPSNWGLPQGQFTGGCDIDEHVKDQQLVFDITFCGDWAGGVWPTDTTCASQASTCQAFVQNSPSAFQDTYWLINSLKVYNDNGAAPAPSATSVATQSQTATPATPTVSTVFVTAATSSTVATVVVTATGAATPNPTSTFTTLTVSLPSTTTTLTLPIAPSTFATFATTPAIPPSSSPTAPASTATWPSAAPSQANTWPNGGSWPNSGGQGGNGGNGGQNPHGGNGGGWGRPTGAGWR